MKVRFNPDFDKVPSLFYASDKNGYKLIEEEFKIRKKHNLPVEFLDESQLFDKYKIKAPGVLHNNVSAQIDAYKAATYLIDYHIKKSDLDVFTETEIIAHNEHAQGYELKTEAGHTIKCKYVIIAAGFEAGKFLPKPVMKLTSTYAIISDPMDEDSYGRIAA